MVQLARPALADLPTLSAPTAFDAGASGTLTRGRATPARGTPNRRGSPARPLPLGDAPIADRRPAFEPDHECSDEGTNPLRGGPAIDLRALLRRPYTSPDRRAGTHAQLSERLKPAIEHVALLADRERLVLEAVISSGLSFVRLEQLTGLSVRIVRTALRNAARRAGSDLFAFVVAQRETMPPMRRAVAEAMVLRGMPLRAIAAELKVSLWTVRTQRQRVLHQYISSRTPSARCQSAHSPARQGVAHVS
jgi:hypothetical protein